MNSFVWNSHKKGSLPQISARWVPNIANQGPQMATAVKVFDQYCDEFLKHIVTGDETWISYVKTETFWF